jgi:hypothetical protein
MKAKDLIELLKHFPEADVVIDSYNGCDDEYYHVDNIVYHENSIACGEDIRTSDKPNAGLITFVLGASTLYDCLPFEISPKETEIHANWGAAVEYCNDLNIDGKIGWRLPSKDELNMIYNSNHDFVKDTPDACYWSSTEYKYNNENAWFQQFSSGNRRECPKSLGGNLVRAIRDI